MIRMCDFYSIKSNILTTQSHFIHPLPQTHTHTHTYTQTHTPCKYTEIRTPSTIEHSRISKFRAQYVYPAVKRFAKVMDQIFITNDQGDRPTLSLAILTASY